MSGTLPLGLGRVLRVLRLIWIVAMGVVLAWHISLISANNPEIVRPVILAYIVVCLPIGIGVMLILALWGSLSDASSSFGRYDELIVACLFVAAGWFQWFRVAPWLVSLASKSFGSRRLPDGDK